MALGVSAADAAAPLSRKALELPAAAQAVKVKPAQKGAALRFQVSTPFKAPAALTVADLAGDYTFDAFDLFEDEMTELTYDVPFTAAGGRIAIEGLVFGEDEVVYADFGAATSAFTIPGNQLLGRYDVEDENGQVSQADIYLKAYRLPMTDEEKAEAGANGLIALPALAGTYDDGSIEFEMFDCLLAEDTEGYFYWGAYFASFKRVATVDPDLTDWKAAGTVTFTDGWLMPAYGIDPVEYPYDLALQVDAANPDRYRIVNPYLNSPAEVVNGDNIGDRQGGIVFDVTDPECVIVEAGHVSGYADADYGKYYLYNEAGLGVALGFSKEEIKELVAGSESTYNNGEVIIPACIFGDDTDPLGGFGWETSAGEPIEMIATIKIHSGVTDVSVDPADAPAEYFNLQGQPVSNPASGQIVIVKRGTDARKAVIR